jgi:hypothetical protein
MKQGAHACYAAIADAVFALHQALHVSGTPSANAVFLSIRRRADTRPQRLHLQIGELAWTSHAFGVTQTRLPSALCQETQCLRFSRVIPC